MGDMVCSSWYEVYFISPDRSRSDSVIGIGSVSDLISPDLVSEFESIFSESNFELIKIHGLRSLDNKCLNFSLKYSVRLTEVYITRSV